MSGIYRVKCGDCRFQGNDFSVEDEENPELYACLACLFQFVSYNSYIETEGRFQSLDAGVIMTCPSCRGPDIQRLSTAPLRNSISCPQCQQKASIELIGFYD